MVMRRARGVRTFRPIWSTKNIEFVHQSPTKVQPGKSPAAPAAAKSFDVRGLTTSVRVRESLWCGEAEARGQRCSAAPECAQLIFPVTSLGIGEVPGFSVHYLYHDVHLFIDPEFTEISLVSFQDAAFLLLHRPFFHFAPPHIGGGLPT